MAWQKVCKQGRDDAWKQRSTYKLAKPHPYILRTKLENGVLSNGQQPQSVVNGFVDQGEFEAVKTLSGREAAHCDDNPLCAKIKVSAWTVFELSLFEQKS